MDEIHRMMEDCIDKVRLSKEDLPVIIVGGGSVLIEMSRVLRGTTQLIIPEHFGVANAIGAALSKVSASIDTVVNLMDMVDVTEMDRCVQAAVSTITDDPDGKKAELATMEARKLFFVKARDQAMEEICKNVKAAAVSQGADEKTLEILNKQDSVIAYAPGNATQVQVKVVGDLAKWDVGDEAQPWSVSANSEELLQRETSHSEKQTISSTGMRIDGKGASEKDIAFIKTPRDPYIDPVTGEWILSEYDIECIVIGAGIYGCGGGGHPQMGRLRALKSIRDGKKMRVVNPKRLSRNAGTQKGIIIVCWFIGAPLIVAEQFFSSRETTSALECLKDVFKIGRYTNETLENMKGVTIETNATGSKFVRDYRPKGPPTSDQNVIALMSAEIGGMNAIEAFLIAANLDMPIVDGDGMSRAFPEVQMFVPYMMNVPPYPVTIVGSGNFRERLALLYVPSGKQAEHFLRDVCIESGCSAGVAMPVPQDDLMTKAPMYTVSRAWRLGDAILRARHQKESVIEAIVQQEDAKHVMMGKVLDIKRETSGGFNRGFVIIEGIKGWLGQELHIDFQNEELVIILLINGQRGPCMGSVPDLICIADADTAEPVTTEELRYGMRVAVLLMPSDELLRQPEALRWVGPKAFHYSDIEFKPFNQRKPTVPIPPA